MISKLLFLLEKFFDIFCFYFDYGLIIGLLDLLGYFNVDEKSSLEIPKDEIDSTPRPKGKRLFTQNDELVVDILFITIFTIIPLLSKIVYIYFNL